MKNLSKFVRPQNLSKFARSFRSCPFASPDSRLGEVLG
jgi:hypothetical protein